MPKSRNSTHMMELSISSLKELFFCCFGISSSFIMLSFFIRSSEREAATETQNANKVKPDQNRLNKFGMTNIFALQPCIVRSVSHWCLSSMNLMANKEFAV